MSMLPSVLSIFSQWVMSLTFILPWLRTACLCSSLLSICACLSLYNSLVLSSILAMVAFLGFLFFLDLGLGLGLGMGFGLGVCFLALRYSVLSFAIWSLISFSLRISSSVGGISHGSGMVDLLYSSLLFRLIWVSLDDM